MSISQISFDESAAQIVITGTSGVDKVEISSRPTDLIHVRVESGGVTQEADFQGSSIASVSFSGGDGNDVFSNATDVRSIVFGGAGDDTITGGAGSDELNGGDGNDLLSGGGGHDMLRGNAGDDILYGNDGNDDLKGDVGNDQLFGGDGDDFLTGADGDDYLRGNAGDDLLYGNDGNDNLKGDEGNDKLFGGVGADFLTGGEGNDYLRGNVGDDRLYGNGGNDNLKGDEDNDLLFGGEGADFLTGGTGDDYLRGNAGDDVLYGNDGNDNLKGDEGDDQLFGWVGADFLTGGEGDDYLRGNAGDDVLYGNGGNDNLSGDEDNDQLFGGEGDDFLTGADGDDYLRGNAGNDLLNGNAGNDNLKGDEDNDQLFGGDGDDFLAGGEGSDSLRGNVGDDQLYGESGNDDLKGDEDNDLLFGGDGDDFLTGAEGNDTLWGASGDDYLLGGDGDDILVGQEGNDYLNAGLGNNVLIGGYGEDSLDGTAGDDLLIGGATLYDGAPDELQKLLQLWTVDASYSQRIATLESESNSVRLEAEETVIDDQVADSIVGGGGSDWFFLTGSMPIYSPVMEAPDDEHDDTGHHNQTVIHTLPLLEGFDLIDSLDNLQDVQDTELIHSKVPHTGDFSRQKEHLSLFQLVRYDEVTHFAIADGDWSNPATWLGGAVPTNGARVLISYGVHVSVDSVIAARIETVRVDGTLSFATGNNSELRVDTMVVGSAGAFEMGTESNPIAPNVKARLLFTNTQQIDRVRDPFGISRGLISHGRTSMYGAAALAQSALQGTIVAGTSQITLTDIPQGWKVGDTIVIAGTNAGAEQDEVRTILGIGGRTVTIVPLAYDHLTPSTTTSVNVAHLSRNAVIESESSAIDRRGHVMFMHSRDVDIQYAGFYRLGRTDKLQVINDPVVNSDWELQPGTGTNPRGRYSVHFHRNGVTDDGNPAAVHGSAVVDSPGWGFVNHSSYVDFTNNVAFNVKGAAFVTEVGDEIGSFRENIAINTTGSGEAIESRRIEQDFGHQGDGFWFQGAGISVTDNVAAGNAGNAFVFYTRGLIVGGITQSFRSDNLIDPSIANGAETIMIDFVPVREFSGNVGFASNVGLSIVYNLRDAPHQQRSILEDSTFWNNSKGIDLPYTQHVVLRNLKIIHSLDALPLTGVGNNVVTLDIAYENLTVVGYTRGIEVPRHGLSIISGGYFNNVENIVVTTPLSEDRTVLITGPVEFGILPVEALAGRKQFDVVVRSIFTPVQPTIEFAFFRDTVLLNYGPYMNQRIYYAMQQPDAIPFPSSADHIPSEYVGLTTQEIRDQFGLTIGGELSPPGAITIPGIIGLVAPIGN